MKSSAKKIELASVDDLFSTEESRQDEQLEKIQEIPLSELHPFKDHPFKVKDDDAMIETADSIKKYGVLVPAIARPLPDGGYELVAGHRRRRASELAGKETIVGCRPITMLSEILAQVHAYLTVHPLYDPEGLALYVELHHMMDAILMGDWFE